MEYFNYFPSIISLIGVVIQYIGLFFIAGAVFVSLIRLPMKQYTMEHIRSHLARKIIFGLEFVIAADVLLATVTTDLNDILRLGAIVLIRVILGYSLRKEIMR